MKKRRCVKVTPEVWRGMSVCRFGKLAFGGIMITIHDSLSPNDALVNNLWCVDQICSMLQGHESYG